jgi:ribosomal protein L2
LKFCNGSISLVKGIFGLFVGDFINTFFCFLKKIKINFLGLQCLVIFIQKYLFISNIRLEFKPNSLYSTSNGCYSQIIDFFFDLNLVKIRFSSGTQKIISGNSICTVGRNNNIYHKYLVYGGYK